MKFIRPSTLALVLTTAFVLPASVYASPMADASSADNGNSAALQSVATRSAEEGFIVDMGDRAIGFLGDQKLSESAKKTAFRKLLNDSFDMDTIARFSLGTYWRSASSPQQKEYMKLFNDMIVKVYSKRFADYKGQSFEVQSSRVESAKDSVVTSFIVPTDGPKVKVDWRVRKKDKGYKVVDVVVEGVSMAQTQRADFASVIQRGGGDVSVLINHLKAQ